MATRAAGRETRERILDTAERLFADRGYAGTSMRAITGAASVNLASVNYYFGSKEALFHSVFERRIGPINRERLQRLEEVLARSAAASTAPVLEDVLHTFVGPALRGCQLAGGPGGTFHRLMGRIYSEPGDHWNGVFHLFEEVKERYRSAFRSCLPHLSPADLFWRLHFVIGVLSHVIADPQRLKVLSDGLCDCTDVESTLHRLVPFLAAGLRAPAPPVDVPTPPPHPSPGPPAGEARRGDLG